VGPFAATAVPGTRVAVITTFWGVAVAVGLALRAFLIFEPNVAPRTTSTMIAARIAGINHLPRGEDERCTDVIFYSLQIECAPTSMQ
jgi:hypothetical protein